MNLFNYIKYCALHNILYCSDNTEGLSGPDIEELQCPCFHQSPLKWGHLSLYSTDNPWPVLSEWYCIRQPVWEDNFSSLFKRFQLISLSTYLASGSTNININTGLQEHIFVIISSTANLTRRAWKLKMEKLSNWAN